MDKLESTLGEDKMAKPDLNERSIAMHRANRGKISVAGKIKVQSKDDLTLAYTPGVAAVCKAVQAKPSEAYNLTCKGNFVAVVSDGTRVLGLGDIGPLAGLPVMEGKALLLKEFGGVDAIPLCLDTKDEDEIVRTVKAIAPSFGAILLEDIESPKCFMVENRLEKMLDIPVFHDDQHGTAIVTLAGLMGALEFTGRKDKTKVKILVNGAGAAGVAIAKLLLAYGFSNLNVVDSKGAICKERGDLEPYKKELVAEIANARKAAGLMEPAAASLSDLLKGADVFIGVSAPNILKAADVQMMAPRPVVFALSNPVPEISAEEAKQGGAAVYASGRSDTANQINNVLCFPGLFRGLLDCRAKRVSLGMKVAAAEAIADIARADGLAAEKIVPDPFDQRLREKVSKVVMEQARKEGLAQA